jgi:hypothetical protein
MVSKLPTERIVEGLRPFRENIGPPTLKLRIGISVSPRRDGWLPPRVSSTVYLAPESTSQLWLRRGEE